MLPYPWLFPPSCDAPLWELMHWCKWMDAYVFATVRLYARVRKVSVSMHKSKMTASVCFEWQYACMCVCMYVFVCVHSPARTGMQACVSEWEHLACIPVRACENSLFLLWRFPERCSWKSSYAFSTWGVVFSCVYTFACACFAPVYTHVCTQICRYGNTILFTHSSVYTWCISTHACMHNAHRHVRLRFFGWLLHSGKMRIHRTARVCENF